MARALKNAFAKEQIEQTQLKIDRTKERLNKLFNVWIDGKIDDDLYNKKSAEFQTELDALDYRLTSLNKSDIEVVNFSKKILELFKAAPDLYLRGSIESKQDLIKLLCSNFLWDGENITITIKKAFQPLVEIASLINGGAKEAKLELLIIKHIETLRTSNIEPLIYKIDELLAA